LLVSHISTKSHYLAASLLYFMRDVGCVENIRNDNSRPFLGKSQSVILPEPSSTTGHNGNSSLKSHLHPLSPNFASLLRENWRSIPYMECYSTSAIPIL
jgi:hypothetical protein